MSRNETKAAFNRIVNYYRNSLGLTYAEAVLRVMKEQAPVLEMYIEKANLPSDEMEKYLKFLHKFN
jgi:hypothetical protein